MEIKCGVGLPWHFRPTSQLTWNRKLQRIGNTLCAFFCSEIVKDKQFEYFEKMSFEVTVALKMEMTCCLKKVHDKVKFPTFEHMDRFQGSMSKNYKCRYLKHIHCSFKLPEITYSKFNASWHFVGGFQY